MSDPDSPSDPAGATAPASGAKPPRRGRAVRRTLLALLAGLMLAVLLLGAGGAWLVRSDGGLRWLLAQVPGLQVSGMRGRPDGGAFQADRIAWSSPTLKITIDGLAWTDLAWRWRPHPGAWLGVVLTAPQARRVEIQTSAAPDDAAKPRSPPPSDLRLPLELAVRGLKIGSVQFNQLAPVTGLEADFHLGAEAGALHRIDRLAAQYDALQARASGQVASGGGMAVQAQIEAGALPDAALPWQAVLTVAGTVPQLQLDAALTAAKGAAATVQATVAPFAAWPLSALQAGTQALDLSALSPSLPQTSLSGRASIASSAADAPIVGEIDFANAVPGPWSAARLPLRNVRGTVRGSLADRRTVAFDGLEVQLEGDRPAGRLTGSGRWQGQALEAEIVLDALRPALLDGRLPAMSLRGPLSLSLQGLPSPDGAAAGAPQTVSGRLRAAIDGRAEAAGAVPIKVAGDAAFTAPADGSLHATLQGLQLSAGAATASLAAELRRDSPQAAQPGLSLATKGEFARFDPALWWPALQGQGAVARPAATAPATAPAATATLPATTAAPGQHLLNGRWSADLRLPSAALSASPAAPRALLQALRGTADLQLADSRLAGVPLQGQASLKATGAGALAASLDIAGNTIAVDLRLAAAGGADRLQADIDAKSLFSLAPLAGFASGLAGSPGVAASWPTAGSVTASATAEGQWPVLRTQGELHATGLRTAAFAVGRADARWSASTGQADAPLALNLQADNLAQGEQRIESLQATLDGSLRAHRLQVRATSPVRPPSWVQIPGSGGSSVTAAVAAAAPASAASAAASAPAGMQLQLQMAGGWQPASAGGGTWQGRIAELLAAPRSGDTTPLLAARNVEATLVLDAQNAPRRASVAPGQIELLGATLRWTEAAFEAATAPGAAPRMRLAATLAPLAVAPWLAQLQPQAGWRGDLRVGGSIQLRSAERFDADVVIEGAGGDLSVVRESRRQPLGVTGVRLALAAHDGTWQFTQALTGIQLGVLAGLQTIRAPPDAAVPPPQSPIDGVIELQIPDADVWSAWLPAGWNLGGVIRTSAALSGTFGAPEYSGRIAGTALSVRNLFQGVDVKDGVVDIALRRTDAKIERFAFKGGSGTLRVEGSAAFGGAPQADLRVVAERFDALSRVDRRIAVSGSATVALRAQSLAVDGRFTVDEGRIDISQADAAALDADVIVVNRTPVAVPPGAPPAPGTAAAAAAARPTGPVSMEPPPPESPLARNARVNLQIDLGKDLRLRGRGIDTGLTGQLRITTPEGRLAINGTVRTEQGTYAAYGQNLEIERGVIRFSGEVAAPRLDILAVRPDLDVRVGVLIQGSAQDPRIRLYSEPDMSDLDKLSWLVTGRASDGLGGADTALLQQAALALLAGEKSSSSDSFVKRLGLDALSVGQTGVGDTRDTVVTVGKQISKRLFVGYARGLNATAGSWQLIYRIAQRFTVRVQSGEESAVDLIWTWRWN